MRWKLNRNVSNKEPASEQLLLVRGEYITLGQLLKAGVAGAEAGNPAGHKLLVMMHYDQGGDNTLSSAFYSQLTSHGVPFDVIGLSTLRWRAKAGNWPSRWVAAATGFTFDGAIRRLLVQRGTLVDGWVATMTSEMKIQ